MRYTYSKEFIRKNTGTYNKVVEIEVDTEYCYAYLEVLR